MEDITLTLNARLRVPKAIFTWPQFRKLERALLKAYQYDIPIQTTNDRGESVTEVTTVASYSDNGVMYGFPRGDLAKLKEHLGSLPWEDRRAVAPLPSKYAIEFVTELEGKERDLADRARDYKHADIPATLRQDQMNVVIKFLEHVEANDHGGVFVGPTGWGKSIAASFLLCCLQQQTLILVEEITCGQNWLDELRAHTNINLLEKRAGKPLIGYYGKDAKVGHFFPVITVATYQSFLRNDVLKRNRNKFGVVLVDEVDRAGARGFSLTASVPNPWLRIGCSATIVRNDGLEGLVFDIIGPVIASGVEDVMPITAYIHELDVAIPKASGDYWFTKSLTHLVGNKKKAGNADYLRKVARRILRDVEDDRFVLATCDRNGFLHRLKTYLEKMLKGEMDGYTPSPKVLERLGYPGAIQTFVGDSQRKKVVEAARSGECVVVLAQSRLMKRTINVKRWDCLHICSPMSGWVKTARRIRLPERKASQVAADFMQLMGRARRVLEGKRTPIVRLYEVDGDDRLKNMVAGCESAIQVLGFSVVRKAPKRKKTARGTDDESMAKLYGKLPR